MISVNSTFMMFLTMLCFQFCIPVKITFTNLLSEVEPAVFVSFRRADPGHVAHVEISDHRALSAGWIFTLLRA